MAELKWQTFFIAGKNRERAFRLDGSNFTVKWGDGRVNINANSIDGDIELIAR